MFEDRQGTNAPEVEPVLTQAAPVRRLTELDEADFAVVLLQALTTMALRSKRRQADLMAALRGADIVADPARVRGALRVLRAQGAIENLVPLSDGGLLLSVTQRAVERGCAVMDWVPPDQLDGSEI